MGVVQGRLFKIHLMFFEWTSTSTPCFLHGFASFQPSVPFGNIWECTKEMASSCTEPFIKQKQVVHGRCDQVLLRIKMWIWHDMTTQPELWINLTHATFLGDMTEFHSSNVAENWNCRWIWPYTTTLNWEYPTNVLIGWWFQPKKKMCNSNRS